MVRSAPTDRVPEFAELGRVHLIGIAGAGMSALARIMLDRQLPVSGCEARESVGVSALRQAGADVLVPQSLDHLADRDTVVYSTAIDPQQFELRAARERGLLVLRRAAGLGAMIAGHRAVAVAGTHGKTSAASLLTVAAQAAGLDPSYAIGANLVSSGVSGHGGSGEVFIVEADESDSSFLLLAPALALVTNVEADHLENHGSAEAMFGAYRLFVDRIEAIGLLVYCADDHGARRLADHARGRGLRVLGYGEAADADVRLSAIVEGPESVEFSVAGSAQVFTIRGLVGRHMAVNAAGVLCVLRELGVQDAAAITAWADFAGIARRFQLHGTAGGVRVYDDYAHHPTEVRAQLAAARAVVASTGGRLVAVFQPGRYSRTQLLAGDFGQALAGADLAVLLDVFPADEDPIPGVSGALVAEAVPLPAERVVYEPDWHAVAARVAGLVGPGDLVLTMGIGDVHLLCPLILAELARPEATDDRPA
ncbi:MAG: UDP-N-acetylmuramate--L-alanine ligase [Jatrophihabitans sp.]